MGTEQELRAATTILFLLFLPGAAYFRFRSATGEPLARQQEGWAGLALRVLGIGWIGTFLFWFGAPASLFWTSWPIPLWLRWFGFGCVLSGFCLQVWALAHLGKNLTDTVVTRKQHRLVTTGPYHWVRHPFYVAVTLGIVGSSLIAANWLLGISGLILLGCLWQRCWLEEHHLRVRFGVDYQVYQERTGLFWPKFTKQPGTE